MLQFLKLLLLGSIFLLKVIPAQATHLIGGSMRYIYLGPASSTQSQYRISLTVYRDCQQSGTPFDASIRIGFYKNGGTFPRVKELGILLTKESDVSPVFGGSNCSGLPSTCIKEGIYEADVILDNDSDGYIAVWKRCCRNTQNNVLDEQGQTYYVEILGNGLVNSSPYFIGVPAPYICANDLVSQLNGASDPDGDSLAYSLVHPFGGGSDQAPVPGNPANLVLPFDTVTYFPGFNANQPFGASGTALIDEVTGLTSFNVPLSGLYAVAIEVREYRNGQLLSTTRRDMQYIVVTCPPNTPPALSGSGGTTHIVEAGRKLCFPVTITDANNDSIYMTVSGDVFTGANGVNSPLATMADKSGKGTVSSEFCWETSCVHARNNSYVFYVSARDNGCPYKTRNLTFNILVRPFQGTTVLNGPLKICFESDTNLYEYHTVIRAGSTVLWEVEGGVIRSGQGTERVMVSWDQPGTGKIRVRETSEFACEGAWIQHQVIVHPTPVPDLNLIGPKDACVFKETRYEFAFQPGWNYQWFADGGTLMRSDSAHVYIQWGPKTKARIKVVQTDQNGCPMDTLYFDIRLHQPMVEQIVGPRSVCPYITYVDYSVTGSPGSQYFWTIIGGTQVDGGNSTHIKVNWDGPGMGYVKVIEQNRFGCFSDTFTKPIIINHVLEGEMPKGDSIICEYTQGVQYRVGYTRGSFYLWAVSGGTIESVNDSTPQVTVNWGAAGWGYVELVELSYDSITGMPCMSSPLRYTVRIAPIPGLLPVQGPAFVCESKLPTAYSVQGFPGSTFRWILEGDNGLNFSGQGKDTILVPWSKPGKYKLRVKETSRYGCEGDFSELEITVRPKPLPAEIQGETYICMPYFDNRLYHVTGYEGSTFNWTVIGGQLVSGQGNDSVRINFDNTVPQATVFVVEISGFGCMGDTIVKKVTLDNPGIEILRVSHSLSMDNTLELNWRLVNAPYYNAGFVIQRRRAGTEVWMDVGVLTGDIFSFEDNRVQTGEFAYEYRIKGVDRCGREIYSTIHRSILLQGSKVDAYDANLYWNHYQGWKDGVLHYEVLRAAGKEAAGYLENRGPDTVAVYTDGFTTYMHCYRIRGEEQQQNEQESYSNELCFYYEPRLYVPNAFTPNDDDRNDLFLLKGGSLQSFGITIYNRWGEQLFKSNDIMKGWDGTYKGVACEQDVYMFIAVFTGYDGRVQTLEGVIHLIR